tara:strand:- start:451 stop:798 length:348 start_codon:yes stop_codon:yes gene_type:complete
MGDLKYLVKEYLYEQLYEAECVLRSDVSKNFTKITDNLRGVCGITVVTIIGPAKKVAENTERSYLKVKFFQVEPTMNEQLSRMSKDARKIDGIFSFMPIRWKKVISRIYRPDRRG